MPQILTTFGDYTQGYTKKILDGFSISGNVWIALAGSAQARFGTGGTWLASITRG
jgi:hypothetical protein